MRSHDSARRHYCIPDGLAAAHKFCPYLFLVVNRKGTLTHAAIGFESGVSV
jgi:hypothetical protein